MDMINFERAASDLFFGERVFAPRRRSHPAAQIHRNEKYSVGQQQRRARDIAVF